jgi:hypothetical protein
MFHNNLNFASWRLCGKQFSQIFPTAGKQFPAKAPRRKDNIKKLKLQSYIYSQTLSSTIVFSWSEAIFKPSFFSLNHCSSAVS